MKKFLVGAIILAVGGYLWWSMRTEQTPPSGTTSAPSESVNPAAGGGTQSGNSNPPPVAPRTGFKDGKYTGSVANSVYGPVQVAVTISGGKIVGVAVPVAPNTPGHTQEVTDFSIPVLKQEAIVAQSAKVDIVSGATQTSEAFQESLASALSQTS